MHKEDELARIVRALNEAMLDDTRWPETSARIDRACGVGGGALSLAEDIDEDRVDVRFARCFCRGVERPDWVRDYFQRYYAEDELVPRMRRLPDSRIVPVRRLYDENELKESRAYNEALARYHMQGGLIVRMEEPGDGRIIWGLGDPVGRDGWSSSRIDMIARILPHLRQYVRVHSTLAEAGALGATAIGLLDNTRAAVVQLDRHGRIVAANDRAREILLQNDGIFDPEGFLRAAAPEDDARLQDLLARALPRFGEQPESGSTWVRRVSLRPSLMLHLTPAINRGLAVHPRGVAALLLIVDPVAGVRTAPGLLGTALGLTPAESEVARLLAEGSLGPTFDCADEGAVCTGDGRRLALKSVVWNVRWCYAIKNFPRNPASPPSPGRPPSKSISRPAAGSPTPRSSYSKAIPLCNPVRILGTTSLHAPPIRSEFLISLILRRMLSPKLRSRVLRSGGWDSDPRFVRAAYRNRGDPEFIVDVTKFGVARSLAQ